MQFGKKRTFSKDETFFIIYSNYHHNKKILQITKDKSKMHLMVKVNKTNQEQTKAITK